MKNRLSHLFLFVFLSLSLVSCSTVGTFKVPEGSQLQVAHNKVIPNSKGEVKINPLFWSVAEGIPYKITKDDKLVKSGLLKSQFRIASIFWTPFAFIYWPMGFKKGVYDLTTAKESELVIPMVKTAE